MWVINRKGYVLASLAAQAWGLGSAVGARVTAISW